MTVALKGSVFFQHHCLFDNIDLQLVAAGWTCLLGSSGAGKSTLLRLLAGLQTEAVFDGRVEFDSTATARQVAYMAQSDLLFPWLTARQNVALGPTLRRQAVDQDKVARLLREVGLLAHQHKKPHQLSVGMRQRAALARTLTEDTPLVLLDEPFAALDARTRGEMQDLAFTALRGKTVLLVTHDPAEAIRLGSRLYIVSRQRLVTYPLPHQQPLRDYDDSDSLRAQAMLLQKLKAGVYG